MEQMFKELVDFLGEKFEKIDQRFEKMDQRFEKMDQRFEKMDQRFDQMDQRFDQMDQRFDRLESQVQNNTAAIEALQGQTIENTDMIKALVHRVDELDAKFDGLLVNTASKESVEKLKQGLLRAVE